MLILNIFYFKSLNFDMKFFWKQILGMSVPVVCSLILGISLNYINLGGSIWELGVKISIYVAIYTGIMWRFAMNDYEKNLFCKPIYRVINAISAHKSS